MPKYLSRARTFPFAVTLFHMCGRAGEVFFCTIENLRWDTMFGIARTHWAQRKQSDSKELPLLPQATSCWMDWYLAYGDCLAMGIYQTHYYRLSPRLREEYTYPLCPWLQHMREENVSTALSNVLKALAPSGSEDGLWSAARRLIITAGIADPEALPHIHPTSHDVRIGVINMVFIAGVSIDRIVMLSGHDWSGVSTLYCYIIQSFVLALIGEVAAKAYHTLILLTPCNSPPAIISRRFASGAKVLMGWPLPRNMTCKSAPRAPSMKAVFDAQLLTRDQVWSLINVFFHLSEDVTPHLVRPVGGSFVANETLWQLTLALFASQLMHFRTRFEATGCALERGAHPVLLSLLTAVVRSGLRNTLEGARDLILHCGSLVRDEFGSVNANEYAPDAASPTADASFLQPLYELVNARNIAAREHESAAIRLLKITDIRLQELEARAIAAETALSTLTRMLGQVQMDVHALLESGISPRRKKVSLRAVEDGSGNEEGVPNTSSTRSRGTAAAASSTGVGFVATTFYSETTTAAAAADETMHSTAETTHGATEPSAAPLFSAQDRANLYSLRRLPSLANLSCAKAYQLYLYFGMTLDTLRFDDSPVNSGPAYASLKATIKAVVELFARTRASAPSSSASGEYSFSSVGTYNVSDDAQLQLLLTRKLLDQEDN